MSGSAFDSEFRISVCLIASLRLKLSKCEGQKGHRYSSSFSSPTGLVKLVIAQWSSVAASAEVIYIFIFTQVLSMSVSFENSICCFTPKVDQLTLN